MVLGGYISMKPEFWSLEPTAWYQVRQKRNKFKEFTGNQS